MRFNKDEMKSIGIYEPSPTVDNKNTEMVMHELAHMACLGCDTLTNNVSEFITHSIDVGTKADRTKADWQEVRTLAVEFEAASVLNIKLDEVYLIKHAQGNGHGLQYTKPVERLRKAKTTKLLAQRVVQWMKELEEK